MKVTHVDTHTHPKGVRAIHTHTHILEEMLCISMSIAAELRMTRSV